MKEATRTNGQKSPAKSVEINKRMVLHFPIKEGFIMTGIQYQSWNRLNSGVEYTWKPTVPVVACIHQPASCLWI